MATNVFNGSPTIAGYLQAFEGGNALITVGRATGFNQTTNSWNLGKGNSPDANGGAGFLVSQYRVTFERGSSLQRFLNMTESVAIVGAGTGRVELTGLVGSLSSFEALLKGNTAGNGKDLCDPVIITISDSGIFRACQKDKTGKVTGEVSTTPGTIICKNAIIQSVNFTGQIDQQGVVMQQATLIAQFTALTISS